MPGLLGWVSWVRFSGSVLIVSGFSDKPVLSMAGIGRFYFRLALVNLGL